jgi:uncharacterized protein (DUF433 family)
MESRIDWSGCPLVESAPGRLNGKPVVKDTRVAADTIAECAELGETPEEIALDYRLKLSVVKALLAYIPNHEIASPAARSVFFLTITYRRAWRAF